MKWRSCDANLANHCLHQTAHRLKGATEKAGTGANSRLYGASSKLHKEAFDTDYFRNTGEERATIVVLRIRM